MVSAWVSASAGVPSGTLPTAMRPLARRMSAAASAALASTVWLWVASMTSVPLPAPSWLPAPMTSWPVLRLAAPRLRCTPAPVSAFRRSSAPSPLTLKVSGVAWPLAAVAADSTLPAFTCSVSVAASTRSPADRVLPAVSMVRVLAPTVSTRPLASVPARRPPSSRLAAPRRLSWAGSSCSVPASTPLRRLTSIALASMLTSAPRPGPGALPPCSWPTATCNSACRAALAACRFSVPASALSRGAALPVAAAWPAKKLLASVTVISEDWRAMAEGVNTQLPGVVAAQPVPAVLNRAPVR